MLCNQENQTFELLYNNVIKGEPLLALGSRLYM